MGKTHKVHPDGGDVALGVRVVREPQEKTRFSHARVTDQQQLKQVITAAEYREWKPAGGTGSTKRQRGTILSSAADNRTIIGGLENNNAAT